MVKRKQISIGRKLIVKSQPLVKPQPSEYDPAFHANVIVITGKEDGSWTAKGQRFGKLIEIRDSSPDSALGRLMTHE